ncbi:MAG TPA: hypothetical protein VN081_02445 [Dongiaceae bacterium]|nr:hypothetical protein [Dongiaceae bacterium]
MTLLAPRAAETRLRGGSALHERLMAVRSELTADELVMLDLLLDDCSTAQQTHGRGFKSIVFAVLPTANDAGEYSRLQKAIRKTACHISHVTLTPVHQESMLRDLFKKLTDIVKQAGVHLSTYTMCSMDDSPQLSFVTFKVNVDPR